MDVAWYTMQALHFALTNCNEEAYILWRRVAVRLLSRTRSVWFANWNLKNHFSIFYFYVSWILKNAYSKPFRKTDVHLSCERVWKLCIHGSLLRRGSCFRVCTSFLWLKNSVSGHKKYEIFRRFFAIPEHMPRTSGWCLTNNPENGPNMSSGAG